MSSYRRGQAKNERKKERESFNYFSANEIQLEAVQLVLYFPLHKTLNVITQAL